jgi:hypothetical protein
MLAETLFDYTDAKARLAALEMREQLRDGFRRVARGEAAQSYLEVVLRQFEADQASGGFDHRETARARSMTRAVDAERIAADAVERARRALVPAAASVNDRRPHPELGRPATTVGADTVDQPLPPMAPPAS